MVTIERGALCRLGETLAPRFPYERILLVTDARALQAAGMGLPYALKAAGMEAQLLLLPSGAAARTQGQLCRVLKRLESLRFGKNYGVAAMGGCALLSVAAMASQLYLGGLPLCLLPATPRAALGCWRYPAHVGGAMLPYAPACVLIDPELTRGAPEGVLQSGLGEALRLCALLGEDAVDALCADSSLDDLYDLILPRLDGIADDALALGYPFDRALLLPEGAAKYFGALLLTRLTERLALTEKGTLDRLKRAAKALSLPTELPTAGALARRLARDPLGLLSGRETPYLMRLGQVGGAVLTLSDMKGAASWRL